MSTHLIEKERAFVDSLAADTGRDLAGWMIAIRRSGRTKRNETIDWLRQQGFNFSHASWLERIHHNGGRLIYGGTPVRLRPDGPGQPGHGAPATSSAPSRGGLPAWPSPPSSPASPQMSPGARPGSATPPPTTPNPTRPPPGAQPPKGPPIPAAQLRAAPPPLAGPVSGDGEVDALLMAAKAYRPLAQAVLRDILAAAPATDTRIIGSLVVFDVGAPFAAIAPTAKGVKLHLVDCGADVPLALRSKSGPGAVPNLTLSLLLTDARQLDQTLMGAMEAAARVVGGEAM